MENDVQIRARQLLADLEAVCNQFDLHSMLKTLIRINNFTNQNNYLDIAVLGQFKAGKSSFLNSFIGQNLLPVGNIPVTSVISRVRLGSQDKAVVTFLDGTSHEISIDEMGAYVSETDNPENTKNVVIIDVETPAIQETLKAVRLVDTPGIGSVWRHNTDATTDWFPETGAVLMLVSAERPISESELELLKEIYAYTPAIAVILTKADLFAKEHITEVENFTQEVLKRTLEREIPIYRYSTRVNTESYNRSLIDNMIIPLAQNREQSFQDILLHKIGTLVETCSAYLEIAYKGSLKRDEEKAQLKASILDEHLNSHFVRRELQLIIGSYKEKTRESIRIYLDTFTKVIENSLVSEYQEAFPGWDGNLYKVTRQYEGWIRQNLEAELKEILLTEMKTMELLNAVRKHLSYYLKSFRERLNENLFRILNIHINQEAWEISGRDFMKPDISVSRSFDSHLDLLWFLFPMFIFRKLFQRSYAGQIPYEVEKNLHRMTSGLTERVNKEMDRMMSEAQSYMNDELKMVERLLSENMGESSLILERMEQLREQYRSLIVD